MSSKPLLTLASVGLDRPLIEQSRQRRTRGMTLVELMIATTILALVVVGVLGSLLHSRRLSEGSISQNSAVAIVQGYIEQMKSMPFNELPYTEVLSDGTVSTVSGVNTAVPLYEVPTRLNGATLDSLKISTSTAFPALSTIGITAGTATDVLDNVKTIDVNMTPESTLDDLRLNLRVWVKDVSSEAINATQVRSITIHYAWQVNEGNRSRVHRGSVRTIRSSVPTF